MEKAVQNPQAVVHLVERLVYALHLALELSVDLLQLLPVIAAVYLYTLVLKESWTLPVLPTTLSAG